MTCRTGWRTRAVPGMAFGCVPSQHGWTRRRSDAFPGMASEGAACDSVPTTTAVGCVPGDGARGPSPHWLVQAMDARPAMAVGCLIRARWRSGRSNHRAESCADRQSNEPLVPAQRVAFSWRQEATRFMNRNDVVVAFSCQNRPDPAAQLERLVRPRRS